MKKTIFSILTVAFALAANAQDGGKKVEAGLNYQMGFGLNKPTTKLMEKGGIGFSNSIGLTLNSKQRKIVHSTRLMIRTFYKKKMLILLIQLKIYTCWMHVNTKLFLFLSQRC